MKILQVTLGFYPAISWGGPVKFVHQIGKELTRRGHEVVVYCTNLLDKSHKIQTGTFEQEIDGMRIVYFDTLHISHWPGTLGPILTPDMSKYLKNETARFDVVHINGYRNLMLPPLIREASKKGIPIVMQPHGTIPVIINSYVVKRLYDRFLGKYEISNISALIALQESERNQAIRLGIPEAKIITIPLGMDVDEKWNPPQKGEFCNRYGLSSDQFLILFLGRINRKKGVDMLVEAFAQLSDLNACLVIAGPDDGQLREVKRLIQKYSLNDRVILTGLLSGRDVMAAFKDSDLFVLPCRTDTFPVTVIESCLAGTPMVITEGCEIANLVKDKVADVVPFDSVKFALAIRKLLLDHEKYNQYRTNCATMIRNTFSFQSMVDRLEDLYLRLVEEKRPESI